MIRFKSKGDWHKTTKWLNQLRQAKFLKSLNEYGEQGVKALSSATPSKTGKTAASWSYEIEQKDGRVSIYWRNSNVNDGVNIAVIIQYGHGTGTGGYIKGIDYINPAMKPIFEQIADSVWKEVTKL